MPASRLVILLFAAWTGCVVLSFVHPYFAPATGEGFVRGLNLIVIWFCWQLAALLVAVVLIAVQYRHAANLSVRLKWLGKIPVILSVIALGWFLGYLGYGL